jgi:DNA-directed RNA polymerase specialized sigma24 family protein
MTPPAASLPGVSRERNDVLAGQQDVAELAPEACPPASPSFESVYRDAHAALVRVAYLVVGSQAVAEELVQEAFMRLHRHFERVPIGEPELDTTWDALASLRPERRAVLVLRYYADMTPDEIARALGCPAATVRTRVHRGLADLRKVLER